MIKLGSHISFKAPHYMVGAMEESIANKANCAMIYLGAPQTIRRVDVEKFKKEEYYDFYADKIKPEDIVVHAPYIVNPTSLEKYKFAISFLVDEIKRMNYLGLKYLVLHPGAYTTFDLQLSLERLRDSLKEILKKTKDVVICIETMSGKGTEVGTNFKQLRWLLDEVNDERLQICLDTCHIWDAGYNIQNYEEFKNELKSFNLLKHIKVIHLNDSKNECGSHKDRHANINEGHIKIDTLAKFVHDKDFDNVPIILETPWTDEGPIYDKEIKMLLEYYENN